jgi:hypothetical protein
MELEIIERPGVGVDRTLIVERLKMTPNERLRRTVEEWEGTAFIREVRAG